MQEIILEIKLQAEVDGYFKLSLFDWYSLADTNVCSVVIFLVQSFFKQFLQSFKTSRFNFFIMNPVI